MSRQTNIVDFEQAKSTSQSSRARKRSNTISGSARKPPAPPSKKKTSAPRPHVAKVAATPQSHRRTSSQAAKNAHPARRANPKSTAPEKQVKAAPAKSSRSKVSSVQKNRTKEMAVTAAQIKRSGSAASKAKTAKASTRKSSVDSKRTPANQQKDPGLKEKMAQRRRQARKKQADKAFDRTVKSSPASSQSDVGGPRAALYQTKMGSSHKRSARMQSKDEHVGLSFGFSPAAIAEMFVGRSRRFYVVCTVAFCLIASAAFLYPATQNYYTAVRDQQRLQAQYSAIEARSDTLQDDIDALSTQSGIEDRARQEYGWVKQGENSVRVSGLSDSTSTSQDATTLVTVGAVTAPDTWYSAVLDPLFGYRK